MKRTALEGGCFVADPESVEYSEHGNWAEAAVIDNGSGAQALSQYLVRVRRGDTPIRRFPGSDVVLFVLNGSGSVLICGRKFDIEKDHGVYVDTVSLWFTQDASAAWLAKGAKWHLYDYCYSPMP